MTYFELFDIPISFTPDIQQVKDCYYKLSRQYHPDFFSQEDEDARADALEKTALVNKAFKTLNNPDDTMKYILQIKGLLEEEKYELSADFLMKVMELNEQFAETVTVSGISGFKVQILNFNAQFYAPVKNIVEHYQDGTTSEEALLQVKEYYFKRKYVQRICGKYFKER